MVKTKALTACLGDGNRAQQGIWRCNTSVNSSRGLLKAQGEKLYAFCMWSLLQAASQTSETAPQTALRVVSQSSQGSCLLFKQHQQSVSQHTRMLLSCVLLSSIFSANAARFAPSLGSGISPHPWKNIMLKRGKEGLSSHLLTLHIWVVPVITKRYFCSACFFSRPVTSFPCLLAEIKGATENQSRHYRPIRWQWSPADYSATLLVLWVIFAEI